MSDTQQAPASIRSDAPPLRMTEAAIARARKVTGRDKLDDIAEALGMTRLEFWRWRTGWDPRVSRALDLSDRLGWPINRIFERTPDV